MTPPLRPPSSSHAHTHNLTHTQEIEDAKHASPSSTSRSITTGRGASPPTADDASMQAGEDGAQVLRSFWQPRAAAAASASLGSSSSVGAVASAADLKTKTGGAGAAGRDGGPGAGSSSQQQQQPGAKAGTVGAPASASSGLVSRYRTDFRDEQRLGKGGFGVVVGAINGECSAGWSKNGTAHRMHARTKGRKDAVPDADA